MNHYPFTSQVAARLVACGFDESDAARLAEKLFLGPTASADEVFSVARMVLTEKALAERTEGDDVQWYPEATGFRYRSIRPPRPSSRPPRAPSAPPRPSTTPRPSASPRASTPPRPLRSSSPPPPR